MIHRKLFDSTMLTLIRDQDKMLSVLLYESSIKAEMTKMEVARESASISGTLYHICIY